MYKTIRMLPAALLLLLLGTACTNDVADTPAETGLPLVLENVYIGAQTRVDATPYDNPEGRQLKATLTWNGVKSTGTYTYQNGQWTSTEPAYWQDPEDMHTLTLHTPEPENDMPSEGFTADNWHEYDILDYPETTVKPGTTTFKLTHTRAQFCVTLEKGDGMTDDELAAATLAVNDTGMLKDKGAHYALLTPAENARPQIVIDIHGSTYTYTPDTDIPLTANTCTILTLNVNKAGVSGITVSGEDWQYVTGTAAIDNTFRQIECDGTSTITIPEEAAKLLITGTLTSNDITAINNAKDPITHLYITATADGSVWQSLKMSIPAEGGGFSPNATLQSICLTQATDIGENAFNYCTVLENATLPKVKSIGSKAFNGCDALTTISLPAATSIGEEAFRNCKSLTNISLPAVTTIANCAFQQCDNLTSISLPAATSIGGNAFYYCTSLTTISLSKGAKDNINEYAFFNCPSLTTLFISTPDATENDAVTLANKIPTLTAIHYNYTGGEDGDYLDPNNYNQVWTRE